MSSVPVFENPCGAYSRYEISKGIPLDRLEAICAAERDGQLYTAHDVAVILVMNASMDFKCMLCGIEGAFYAALSSAIAIWFITHVVKVVCATWK